MRCSFKFRGTFSLLFKWETACMCLFLLGNWAFLSCVSYVFVRVCLYMYVLCGHLLGKGWPLGSRLWCLTVSMSLSHWYPGSGVVLDCIDSWSLHPYLLLISSSIQVPKWVSHVKCVLEEFWKNNSQNSQSTQYLRYFKYLSPIKLITKYYIWVFCIQFSGAMETVNHKFWRSSCFQKVNIQLECFIF